MNIPVAVKLNADELRRAIQAEGELASIRKDALISEQVKFIREMLEENENLIDSSDELKNRIIYLEKEFKNGGRIITDEFGTPVLQNLEKTQDELVEAKIKLGELTNASSLLKNEFLNALKQGAAFGDLNGVVEQLRPLIEGNTDVSKIFFDVIHAFTGQAVNDWNAVIQAVKNYKNESVSAYVPKPGDYDVPLPPNCTRKSNTPKVFSPVRTNINAEENKELNFLEHLREKVKILQDDVTELTGLQITENLQWYERLAIATELIEKNRELNELTKSSFQNVKPRTTENIKESEVRLREPLKLGGGGTFKKLEGVINPHLEFAKRMQDIYDGMANGVMGSMGSLFASLVPPQAALSPLEQFMKQIVITFINAVQGLVLAAAAALPAKGITTFGISIITDAPLLAAAYAALEIAKGFIGGFAKGTDYLHKSGYALVGEQGPELVYLNRGAKVFNNNDTSKMLNSARANTALNTNVNNVYISSSLDALSFFRVNYPKYKKFKRLQSN